MDARAHLRGGRGLRARGRGRGRRAGRLRIGGRRPPAFLERFGREFPATCRCLSEDLEAQLALLELPWRHRKYTRTTNFIERSFVVERRRTKTLLRLFTERSRLKLVHATLIRAAVRWQRVRITALELEQIRLLYEARRITPAAELEDVA